MFCPQCGQQQISSETRFCSRCGFLLTGVADLIARGGQVMETAGEKPVSPRKRGLKHGLFLMLMTLLIVPIVAMISISLRMSPAAAGLATVLFFVGGLLRMVYALMFESPVPGGTTLEQHVQGTLNRSGTAGALPPRQTMPASDYISPAANWRETNELATPGSVTDSTTKLLERSEGQ